MTALDKIGFSGVAAMLVVAGLGSLIPTKIAIAAIILAGNPVLVWWICAESSCAWMLEQFRYRDLLQQSDVHQINVWWFAGLEMAATKAFPAGPLAVPLREQPESLRTCLARLTVPLA